ncbi:MAG: ribosomal RNA small subunit methyltransferase I [Acidimicrobiales bacterium]|nr:MAG: ribosomal RNA small subunit methyltransferase I [Acidimicrobiales bacterium]
MKATGADGGETTRDGREPGEKGPQEPGAHLVVVSTPIGNLEDLSPRAREALASADVFACEDTRVLRKLLSHLGLSMRPTVVIERHREARAAADVVRALEKGRRVALVTDAGTPCVSDPGARVVDAVARAGLPVTAVPGPSALLAGLVVSGFEADRFCFEGFLPKAGRKRRERLAALAGEERTIVLYEAPTRIRATLSDLAQHLGAGRRAVVARELTKRFEEIHRGRLGDLAERVAAKGRGEHVVVIEGVGSSPARSDRHTSELVEHAELVDQLRAELSAGATRRDAAEAVAARTGVPKRRVYELVNQIGERASDNR